MTSRSASLPMPLPSFRDRLVPTVSATMYGATVVAENAFTGAAPFVGEATTAARSDHTHGTPSFGPIGVTEQSFGQSSGDGVAVTASRSDHTHGTPLPRHPQTGSPHVDFGTSPGLLQLSRRSADHFPALIGTEDITVAERLFLTSPVRTDGSGRATLDLYGGTNGEASAKFYNDLDVDGAYTQGTGSASRPFILVLEGQFVFNTIANTPAVSIAGQASIYYKSSTGKMQISENGGAYVDLVGSGGVAFGGTVVAETAFSQSSAAGVASAASRSDHTHGTPLPRHPQTGFPFVDFSGGGVVLGRFTTEFNPAQIGTQDLTTSERLFLVSPMRSSTSGRATAALIGKTDGNAILALYNDLDINNNIGDTADAGKPFGVELTGDFTFFSIANTPPVAPAGQARLYFVSDKLKLSENGGAYRNIGSDLAPGAAGSFLVTNTTGTSTVWAATTEIYFDDTNNRIGIGTTVPQERLSVRDGTAGIIATFFGPIGLNEINVGNDKTSANSLRVGYSDTDNYGFLQVTGATAGGLVIKSDGKIGIGALPSNAYLSFGGLVGTAAIALYDGGAGVRYGFGIQASEMQFFIPTVAHWSWNSGGDLQTSGSNELMRLTGAGDLGIGIAPTAKLHLHSGNMLVGNIATNDEYVQIGKSAGLGGSPGVFGGNGLGWTIHGITNTGVLAYYGTSLGVTYQCLWIAGPTETSSNGRLMMQTLNFGTETEMRIYNDRRTNGTFTGGDSNSTGFDFCKLNVYGPVQSNGTTLTSARALKRDIRDDDDDSLDIVRRFRKRKFRWLYDSENDAIRTGFVADEVAAAYGPLAAYDHTGKVIGWKHDEMTAHLVGGVQTLAERCDELERQNAELAARLDALAA